MARRFPWLWMGLLVACTLIAVLAWQNRQLRVQQHWLQTRISTPYDGMYVPRIEATDGDGRRHLLGAPHGPAQVLFFFTTTCPYCQRSAPTVLRAARAAGQPARPAAAAGRVPLRCRAGCALRTCARFRFPGGHVDRSSRADAVPRTQRAAADGHRWGGARASFASWRFRYHGAGAGPRCRLAPHGRASGFCNGEGVMHEEALGKLA